MSYTTLPFLIIYGTVIITIVISLLLCLSMCRLHSARPRPAIFQPGGGGTVPFGAAPVAASKEHQPYKIYAPNPEHKAKRKTVNAASNGTQTVDKWRNLDGPTKQNCVMLKEGDHLDCVAEEDECDTGLQSTSQPAITIAEPSRPSSITVPSPKRTGNNEKVEVYRSHDDDGTENSGRRQFADDPAPLYSPLAKRDPHCREYESPVADQHDLSATHGWQNSSTFHSGSPSHQLPVDSRQRDPRRSVTSFYPPVGSTNFSNDSRGGRDTLNGIYGLYGSAISSPPPPSNRLSQYMSTMEEVAKLFPRWSRG